MFWWIQLFFGAYYVYWLLTVLKRLWDEFNKPVFIEVSFE